LIKGSARASVSAPSALDAAARRVLRLDVHRQLVDLLRIGDHQPAKIVTGDREDFVLGCSFRHPFERRWLTYQTKTI
jgi:hypothetical protein